MITYHYLRDEDKAQRGRLCQVFYDEIYRDAFPDPNEAESPDQWLPLMGDDAPDDKPALHMIVACDGSSRVVGGVIFEWYRHSECWLITYLAVRPQAQRTGIAKGLMRELSGVVSKRGPGVVFAECENPRRMLSCATQVRAIRRARVLERLGMRCLPVDYVQPALRPSSRALENLLLVRYLPDGRGSELSSERLSRFLCEFYGALGQPNSPFLLRMVSAIGAARTIVSEDLTPWTRLAADDDVLGSAANIAVRLSTFQANVGERRVRRRERRTARLQEVPLYRVRSALIATGLEQLLSAPVESFYRDIVTPYATESSLPLIVLCEPFSDDGQAGSMAPYDLAIQIPSCFEMEWERRSMVVAFTEDDEPYIVRAKMVDSCAFFESGYISYSVSILLTGQINAAQLLALETIAKPAGRVSGELIGFSLGGGVFEPFFVFAKRRLESLRRSRSDGTNVFALLGALGAVGARLENSLLSAFTDATGDTCGDGSTDAEPMMSIDLEIIGSTEQERVLDYAERAQRRETPVDEFSRRLAGVVQNVLDFTEQDSEEVNDSLSSAIRIGRDIAFAHKDVTVRFSERSRAFSRMSTVLGGSPYWLFVQLVAGHNEKLLWDLNVDLENAHRRTGVEGMANELLRQSQAESIGSAEAKLRATQHRRLRLAYYIPNLFRYRTEIELYRLLSDARGLNAQKDYFLGLEETVEKIMREASAVIKDRADWRITKVLVALGAFQVAGVFAALAALANAQFRYVWWHHGPLSVDRFLADVFRRHIPPSDPRFHLWAVWALWAAFLVLGAGLVSVALAGLGAFLRFTYVRMARLLGRWT